MSEQGRRRPSGAAKTSRRFATVSQPDGSELKIPAVKDSATFIYVADENRNWPRKPTVTILGDLPYLTEHFRFQLREMRPGQGMGDLMDVMVIDSKFEIGVFNGVYGQTKRLVLVEEVPSVEAIDQLFKGGQG